jgi:outer membrane protein with beta-barrel domain
MQNNLIVVVVFAGLLGFGSTPVAAQRRAPAAGMWAVGGSIGPTSPADTGLDNGVDLVGNAEWYATPRLSVRGQLGGARWDVLGRGPDRRIAPFYADGNVVYNWEGGAVHPYVTGGLGVYRFRSSLGILPDTSDTHLGLNGGGGVEYFVTRRSAVTGELLLHKVGVFTSPLTTSSDGSFWSVSFGAKVYFPRR